MLYNSISNTINNEDAKYNEYISNCDYKKIIINPDEPGFSKRIVKGKRINTPRSKYTLYHYDKTILSRLDTVNSKYRSVLFSYPENKLVCFSPPKSLDYSDFIQKYPKIGDEFSIVEKIEGISIQLFYDERIHSWEIATKTNIGGNYWYFANTSGSETQGYQGHNVENLHPTFYDMFLDAIREPRNKKLSDIYWIEHLPTSHCYSFVLQHPENKIIMEVDEPTIFLVAVYYLESYSTRDIGYLSIKSFDETNHHCSFDPTRHIRPEFFEQIPSCTNIHTVNQYIVNIPPFVYKKWSWLQSLELYGVVRFPKVLFHANNSMDIIRQIKIRNNSTRYKINECKYNVKSYNDLASYYSEYSKYSDENWCGIVIWNHNTDERTTIENPNYTSFIKMVKIPPWLHYNYLCTKRINKLDVFIEYYTKYKSAILFLDRFFDKMINTLHECYMAVFVKKIISINKVSYQFRPYIEELHKLWYLPFINTAKPQKITKHIVKKYIESKDPQYQLYMFSYYRRCYANTL